MTSVGSSRSSKIILSMSAIITVFMDGAELWSDVMDKEVIQFMLQGGYTAATASGMQSYIRV